MRAGFLGGARGALMYVLHTPRNGTSRGSVLYAHPFAEEHNKSRRMAACQARALAERGYTVLMPDLYGCGDSAGDFGEADWHGWIEDLRACLKWLGEHHPGPVTLWGLRTGCLLLGELLALRRETGDSGAEPHGPAPEAFSPAATVFWQPVLNGELFLTQFLRLRMAAGMIGGSKETTKDLRARLAAGESLEVAGYELSPSLASGLAAARLGPSPAGTVHWLEVTAAEGADLPPASRKVIADWGARGIQVRPGTCVGEAFWTSQEIREVPALLDGTLSRLTEGG